MSGTYTRVPSAPSASSAPAASPAPPESAVPHASSASAASPAPAVASAPGASAVPSVLAHELPRPVPMDEFEACPASDIFRRVGDKWTVLVVILLGGRPHRYNELHRSIGGISQRMLTRTLRGLETDGLVHREVHPTVPPRVEYRLTPLGGTLLGPLSALADWAVTHEADIAAARAGAAAGQR